MNFLSGLFGDGGSTGSSNTGNQPTEIDESTNTLINFGSGAQGLSNPMTLTSTQPYANSGTSGGSGSSGGGSSGFGSIMSIIGIVAALL
jgi:hypothetical protein